MPRTPLAARTHARTQVKVLNGTDDRGSINFGLFNGGHRIRYRESQIADTIVDSYLLRESFISNSCVYNEQ